LYFNQVTLFCPGITYEAQNTQRRILRGTLW